MKKISMTTENGMQVVGESLSVEFAVADFAKLVNETWGLTEEEIDEKDNNMELPKVDFDFSFVNDQEREKFIALLKDRLKKDDMRDYTYYTNSYAASRNIVSELNKVLPNMHNDFVDAIRQTQIALLEEELEAFKSDEVKAYIDNLDDVKGREFALNRNKQAQDLLTIDILTAQIAIQHSKFAQLQEKRRNNEITAIDFSRQWRQIDAQIDELVLQQEKIELEQTELHNEELNLKQAEKQEQDEIRIYEEVQQPQMSQETQELINQAQTVLNPQNSSIPIPPPYYGDQTYYESHTVNNGGPHR